MIDFFKKRDNKSRAGRLQQMRLKRLKAEGQARLIKLEREEERRLDKAKATIKSDTPFEKAKAKLAEMKKQSQAKKPAGAKLGGSLTLGGNQEAYKLGGKQLKP